MRDEAIRGMLHEGGTNDGGQERAAGGYIDRREAWHGAAWPALAH